jgi:hypothetical protein
LDLGKISSFTLEQILDIEKQIYILYHNIDKCEICSGDLSCMVEVLGGLDHLSILYKAAQTAYICSNPSGPRHDAANNVTRTADSQPGLPRLEKAPVKLGRIELEEQESDVVGRTLVNIGLSWIQATVKALRRKAQSEANAHRGLGSFMSQTAEVDFLSEGILSRVWETIAHGRM